MLIVIGTLTLTYLLNNKKVADDIKNKQLAEDIVEKAPENKNVDKSLDSDGLVTLDSVLTDLALLVDQGREDTFSKEILWNTQDGEVPIKGEGYLFVAEQNTSEYVATHRIVMEYFRDKGFEYDKYNIGNSRSGYQRDLLRKENLGCELYLIDDTSAGKTDFGIICVELPKEITELPEPLMSEKKARSIAEASSCLDEGILKDMEPMYNENSKTWWFDMQVEDKPGCNPACVVSEDESVEINWRCTGLIPE
ncbi:MAG: hypothetical protein JW922_09440 [Paludibacteraceae bacterium]|nr:hypothetical protein [Paludibacteraceae bacterium]